MNKIFYTFIDLQNNCYDFQGFSLDRKNYVNMITDKLSKNRSYYVWKLLLYALLNSNINPNQKFISDKGRWYIEDSSINFSLSHSDNLVAVIISDTFCGIDVEKITDKSLKLEKRYISTENFDYFSALCEKDKKLFLTKKWCEEECRYKAKCSYNNIFCSILCSKNKDEFVLASTSDVLPKEIDINEIV